MACDEPRSRLPCCPTAPSFYSAVSLDRRTDLRRRSAEPEYSRFRDQHHANVEQAVLQCEDRSERAATQVIVTAPATRRAAPAVFPEQSTLFPKWDHDEAALS